MPDQVVRLAAVGAVPVHGLGQPNGSTTAG
jgi:hypothetical protein